jgi:hypothetical protein
MTDSRAVKTTTLGATMKILLFVLTILSYTVASNEKVNEVNVFGATAFESTQNLAD